MRDRLPPLNLLATLETVVRAESFVKAAAELFVTPSAISGQMRLLEEHLGQALFLRRAQGIEVLPEARAYAERIRSALEEMRAGHRDFQQSSRARPRLVISSLPSFAHCWLVPHLAEFNHAYPSIDVSVEAEDEIVDFNRRPEVSIGIRCTDGQHPEADVYPLFEDLLAPVCAPHVAELLAAGGEAAQAISQLVDTRWDADWTRWRKEHGALTELVSELRFSHYSMMIQAAVNGLGIAMAHIGLSADAIHGGRLVLPIVRAVPAPMRWYLATRKNGRDNPAVDAFHQWIFERLAQDKLLWPNFSPSSGQAKVSAP